MESVIPQEYFNKIKKYFNGDDKKTWDWFNARNPAFGMFSPMDMIKLGREKKLMLWIDNSLNGIHP